MHGATIRCMTCFTMNFPLFPISYFSLRSVNYPQHRLLKPPPINVCSKTV